MPEHRPTECLHRSAGRIYAVVLRAPFTPAIAA